jgi:hypothetical protein
VKDAMVPLLLMHVTIIATRVVMDVIKGIGMRFQATGTPGFQQGESSQLGMHRNNFDVDINQA